MDEIKADSLLLWQNVRVLFDLFKSSAVALMKPIRTAIMQNQLRRFSIDGKQARSYILTLTLATLTSAACTHLHRSRALNAAVAFTGRRCRKTSSRQLLL